MEEYHFWENSATKFILFTMIVLKINNRSVWVIA